MGSGMQSFIRVYSNEGVDLQNTQEVQKLSKIVDNLMSMATHIKTSSQLSPSSSAKCLAEKQSCSLPRVGSASSSSNIPREYDLEQYLPPNEGVKELLLKRKLRDEEREKVRKLT